MDSLFLGNGQSESHEHSKNSQIRKRTHNPNKKKTKRITNPFYSRASASKQVRPRHQSLPQMAVRLSIFRKPAKLISGQGEAIGATTLHFQGTEAFRMRKTFFFRPLWDAQSVRCGGLTFRGFYLYANIFGSVFARISDVNLILFCASKN